MRITKKFEEKKKRKERRRRRRRKGRTPRDLWKTNNCQSCQSQCSL